MSSPPVTSWASRCEAGAAACASPCWHTAGRANAAAAAGPPGVLAHKSNALMPLVPYLLLQKLKVLSSEPGADADEGFVTFQAWFKNVGQLGQRAQGFHTQTFVERSRFLRTEAGRWLYGERPAPGAAASSLVTSIGACGMWAMRLPMPAQRLPVHTSRA